MSQLAEAQAAFAAAVFDPNLPVPPGLIAPGGSADDDRFAVYRNNVMVGLTEGLRDAYPVVCRLVGDEFFRAMAAVFARSRPPRSPVMHNYGAGFAEFILGFPPVAELPYLADVARLERAWVEAYHAAEADALKFTFIQASLALHPATRLVRSPFPVFAIWEANRGDEEPGPLELSGEGDNVLVTRPVAEVQACRVSDKDADLIEAIMVRALPVSDARAHLSELCSLGMFSVPEVA